MSERETTFENAKKGDRVYSPLFGNKNPDDKTNAVILSISESLNFPIIVEPDVENIAVYQPSFTFKGEFWLNTGQVLFWENPIKEIPLRTKRIVKKTGYIGIASSLDLGCLAITTAIYATPVEVSNIVGNYKIRPIEFEMEE